MKVFKQSFNLIVSLFNTVCFWAYFVFKYYKSVYNNNQKIEFTYVILLFTLIIRLYDDNKVIFVYKVQNELRKVVVLRYKKNIFVFKKSFENKFSYITHNFSSGFIYINTFHHSQKYTININ